ncbi:hypothetical protein WH95_04180 [Kiloniella litopenaei]|uniref:Uncharacterized protein n=1 Tax=Kiloniella litopenaei TaxID=1549748 RepID=A0A0M2RDP5_9PROT|nr:hypothetical protein WH95_04180 [Kiloniella litopenaei]
MFSWLLEIIVPGGEEIFKLPLLLVYKGGVNLAFFRDSMEVFAIWLYSRSLLYFLVSYENWPEFRREINVVNFS